MEDERLRRELAARRATAARAEAVAPPDESTAEPGEVACARCGVLDEPEAMLFGADGLICAVCHGEATVDGGLLGRAQLRSPLDPAFLSVLASTLFWVPIAGPAFVLVGWLFGLLAVRGSARNVVAAHREEEATVGALALAWLGVAAGLFATGFALQASVWLWQLWVAVGAFGG